MKGIRIFQGFVFLSPSPSHRPQTEPPSPGFFDDDYINDDDDYDDDCSFTFSLYYDDFDF